jgi:Reverse transcriptase (RNA-dependent DNA polymerase)
MYQFYSPAARMISSFLSCSSLSVEIDGVQSSPYFFSSGVPQGSVLAPLLLWIFIFMQSICQLTSLVSEEIFPIWSKG